MRSHDSTLPALARLLCAVLAFVFAGPAQAAPGPSFDCARVTSKVNRMICASSELSELDRLLTAHYRVLLAQSGAEAPALQREELQWLHEVRDPCPDAACIAQAYEVWDAVLVARSRRLAIAGPGAVTSPSIPPISAVPLARPAARPPVAVATVAPARNPITAPPSPAAAAQTQPFPVDPAILADARALRGHACAPGEDVPRDAGFLPVPGEFPAVASDSVVLVRRHLEADFAVLLDTRHNACRMVDVVALPARAQVGNVLQCLVPADDGSATPLSAGIGLRRPGQGAALAYWEVDVAHGQFIRQPLGVLDWTEKLRCRQPEFGD
jgi:uncharacterized protein YecT (DUF1311 family)